MESTFTTRDKALLIILGIIVLVFGAVMFPKIGNTPIGIYSLITERTEVKNKMIETNNDNDEKLSALIDSGIEPAFAESAVVASNRLNSSILTIKQEIAKMAQNADKEGGYKTAKKWIEPVKYENFVVGGEELLTNFEVKNNQDGFSQSNIIMGDAVVEVYQYSGEAVCDIIEERVFNFQADNYENIEDIRVLAAYNVLAAQLIRRGSIGVFDYRFNPETASYEGKVTVPFSVYTPIGEELAQYSSEVCECHVCGWAYYKSWYEENVLESDQPLTCQNPDQECDAVLDGSTIG